MNSMSTHIPTQNHLPFSVQASWQGELPYEQAQDAFILSQYYRTAPWGIDAAIDLARCNLQLICDPDYIRLFAIDLCEKIHMIRFGDPQIVRFGADPRVSGYTLIQLIETSDIAAHFIDQAQAACLNVFSCSAFAPYETAALCQRWFEAQEVHLSVIFRGPSQRSARHGSPRLSAQQGRKE